MRIVNDLNDPRILKSQEMVRSLSTADTPYEVLMNFARHYWPLHPIDRIVSISRSNVPDGHYRLTRNINVAEVLRGNTDLEGQPWTRTDLPLHRGGFIGWAIEQNRPMLIYGLDVSDDPALDDTIADMRSVMCLPLFHNGTPLYWNFQFRRDPEGFSTAEFEQALLVSNFVGGTNTRLLLMNEVKRLNTALRQQFEDVARVQRSLLPKQIPDIPGLEIATSYLTSDQAGGDYYDFFPFDEDKWGILIADVAGHGAAAATVMAMLHGILHAYAGDSRMPDAVLRYANDKLVAAGLESSFVTAFFAVYDPRNGTLTFARSGHNPPLLKSGRTGHVTHLDGVGAPPLGVFEEYEIACDMVRLQPHDTLVLYTDGITEAFSADREMFGPHRLDQALTECTGMPDCVVDSVHKALYAHTGSLGRSDDQTLVALRYVGPG